MNNIEFSIVNNQSRTKFKIAYTIKITEFPVTKVMTREFPTEEAAQEYLERNKEALIQKIRERISKMIINVPEVKEEKIEEQEVVVEEAVEEVTETAETEEVVEEVETVVETEETELTEEIADENANELSETEEVAEEVTEIEETTEEIEENTEITALVPAQSTELVPVEEYVVVRKPKRKVKIARRILAVILAIVLLIGLHHVIKRLKGDYDPEVTPDTPIEEPIIETLTTEEFEKLVAYLAKDYQDKGVNLTLEDITKFVSIVNIDNLTKENPELAKELFGDLTKEEYIQDAANVISATVMYNAQVFEEEKSTENFIRISDALYGPSKEQMQIFESYVDRIAEVSHDPEQVNALVGEMITRRVTGDLSNLDNGVQFGMQISIELIRSYIAKDTLTDVNRDVLTGITRLNLAGIMQMYDNANGLSANSKTRK